MTTSSETGPPAKSDCLRVKRGLSFLSSPMSVFLPRVIALMLVYVSLASGQPLSAGNELIHPVNPPRPLPAQGSPQATGETAALLNAFQKSLLTIRDLQQTNDADGTVTLTLNLQSDAAERNVPPQGVEVKAFFFEKSSDGTILPVAIENGMLVDGPSSSQEDSPIWSYQLRYTPERDKPGKTYEGYAIGLYQNGMLRENRTSSPEIRKHHLAHTIPVSTPNPLAEALLVEVQALRNEAKNARLTKDTAAEKAALDKAADRLQKLTTDYPDWNPSVQEYLRKTVADRLKELP